jgi:Tol biopolymer transport system component
MGRHAGAGVVAVALLAACNAHLGDPTSHGRDPDAGMTDAAIGILPDGPATLGPWGTPTVVAGASSTANNEDDPTLSSDGLELYYAVQVPGNPKDLYVMTRASTTVAFGAPTALAGFNTLAGSEESPRLAYDDLAIYFGRDGDIFKATRATKASPWGPASLVTGVSTAMYEKWLAVCGDGSHIMLSRDIGTPMAPNPELFEGTFADGAATQVTVLSSAASEISTFLAKDCLTVMFASNRSGAVQLYISKRTALASPWSAPALLGAPFDTGADNEDPSYTPDDHIFAFAGIHAPATTKDVYLSTR